jgi:hypothetical protein
MGFRLRRVVFTLLILGSSWLAGCSGKSDPALTATLTFKDGSRFAGSVVRREATSITLVDTTGTTRTFLYTELADIKYSTPGSTSGSTGAPAATPAAQIAGEAPAGDTPAVVSAPLGEVKFPVGTEFPVVTKGYLDSCCVPVGAFSVGTLDGDVKVGGKVMLPRGTSVTIMLTDEQTTDGRLSMKFEIGAADFGGHQYVIASEKGGLEPGMVAVFFGEKAGTPEARKKGTAVHLDDHELMMFKAATPTLLKLPQ